MGLFGKMFSKKKNEEVVENVNTEVTGSDLIIAGEVVKEGEIKEDPSVYYILYVNKLSGLKGVPFNTFILLVNDHSKNNLTINYEVEGEFKTETISRTKIKEVGYVSRVQMDAKVEAVSEELKNKLAANALFGDHPLNKVLGANVVNYNVVHTIENKEVKGLNTNYEITITYINEEDESQRLMFGTSEDPEKFINFLKSNINK